jgi:hypothetical protein
MNSKSLPEDTRAFVLGAGGWFLHVISAPAMLAVPDDQHFLHVHQQCGVNYHEVRRATVWSYEFHRRIDGRMPPAEGTRPCEKLPIPTDLAIAHITLLVGAQA